MTACPSGSLTTWFPVRRAVALSDGIRLGHILPLFRFPVPLVVGAVVDMRGGVHPDFARAPPGAACVPVGFAGAVVVGAVVVGAVVVGAVVVGAFVVGTSGVV